MCSSHRPIKRQFALICSQNTTQAFIHCSNAISLTILWTSRTLKTLRTSHSSRVSFKLYDDSVIFVVFSEICFTNDIDFRLCQQSFYIEKDIKTWIRMFLKCLKWTPIAPENEKREENYLTKDTSKNGIDWTKNINIKAIERQNTGQGLHSTWKFTNQLLLKLISIIENKTKVLINFWSVLVSKRLQSVILRSHID